MRSVFFPALNKTGKLGQGSEGPFQNRPSVESSTNNGIRLIGSILERYKSDFLTVSAHGAEIEIAPYKEGPVKDYLAEAGFADSLRRRFATYWPEALLSITRKDNLDEFPQLPPMLNNIQMEDSPSRDVPFHFQQLVSLIKDIVPQIDTDLTRWCIGFSEGQEPHNLISFAYSDLEYDTCRLTTFSSSVTLDAFHHGKFLIFGRKGGPELYLEIPTKLISDEKILLEVFEKLGLNSPIFVHALRYDQSSKLETEFFGIIDSKDRKVTLLQKAKNGSALETVNLAEHSNSDTSKVIFRIVAVPNYFEITLNDENTPQYVTTPIYYPNDVPHIGHAYTTILGDILRRFSLMCNKHSFLLTGVDEHGQKVQQAAEARSLTPQAHVDDLALKFQETWDAFDVTPSVFMRTTNPTHVSVVQNALQILFDKGDIYRHEYEGWYSVSEEIFYTDKDLVNGKSPSGKEVTRVRESNYFFRMAQYQEQLVRHILNNPDFVRPEGKLSEVLGFLKNPMSDLCISRPKARVSWGVELPFDKDFVTYVWFDALLNYASAIGALQSAQTQDFFHKVWPTTIHLIGKDILIPHCVYWPVMLMSLDLPLPRCIYAHGWWLNKDGAKMSKSEGEVISPIAMRTSFGKDPFRYFMVRGMILGNDVPFSTERAVEVLNAELANNLGNLLSRVTTLVSKYFDGRMPAGSIIREETRNLMRLASNTPDLVKDDFVSMRPYHAVGHILTLLTETNRYLDAAKPWNVAKNPIMRDDARECLATCLEVLRISGTLLWPVMPTAMKNLLTRVGWSATPSYQDCKTWGLLQRGATIAVGEPLFPRIASK